jgi:hypothetical protein
MDKSFSMIPGETGLLPFDFRPAPLLRQYFLGHLGSYDINFLLSYRARVILYCSSNMMS